mgnify:CR=1 FL=1
MRRRVVVTGLGVISPVGNTVAEAWSNLVAGRSGITAVTRFDASTFPSRIAGEVKGFNVADYLPAKDARRMDTFIHYGMAAGIQAIPNKRDSTASAPPSAIRLPMLKRAGCTWAWTVALWTKADMMVSPWLKLSTRTLLEFVLIVSASHGQITNQLFLPDQ